VVNPVLIFPLKSRLKMAGGKSSAHISTEVTFEDGRKGVIEADLKIKNMVTHTASKFDEAAE